MMPLETKAIRRDRSVERMQRRKADRAFTRGGEPFDVTPDDFFLELRRLAIGPHSDALAEIARPVRHVRRLVLGIAAWLARECRAGCYCSASSQTRAQETAARGETLHAIPPVGFIFNNAYVCICSDKIFYASV